MFPGGLPGAALLLLRLTLGGTALLRAGLELSASDSVSPSAALVAADVAVGLALLGGFLTPIASALAIVRTLAVPLAVLPARGILEGSLVTTIEGMAIFYAIAIAAALAALGPGAWSVDAYLFGRREIILPASRQTKS